MQKSVLKEPGVCRIFFSSPFNGMEGEREEFTKNYWPQIDVFCRQKGMQFVPVDMRWGITTELSDNNQTINICLSEIDRSDMFVGFFGQRYGWHGANDETLQKNFDAALPSFPWIDKYRDKSITELEFLHGHLNSPGRLPAVICFRDRRFDDTRRDEALQRGDKRGVAKFSSESEQATSLMDDLKARVKATEGQCLAVNLAYETPQEGARFMFEALWPHLTEVLLAGGKRRSELEQQKEAHVLFANTRLTSYVPNESLMNTLDTHVNKGSGSGVVLVGGGGGSGKTSLLASWLNRLKRRHPHMIVVPHFVGCTAESTRVQNILLRLVAALRFSVEGQSVADKSSVWSELESELGKADEGTLARLLHQQLNRCTQAGNTVVIAVVGLNKLNYGGVEKTVQPLFWMPNSMPSGSHLVVSTGNDDTRHITTLKEKFDDLITVEMEPLSREQQEIICKQALKLRGKTLSSSQLETILEASGPSNPLFLNVVLEELCMFGKFRELDAKIKSLVNSENCVVLFEKYLQRLENDYNANEFNGNLVEQVVSALAVSQRGLQESELLEMLDIPQNIWPPLYYGLQKYLVSQQGFLRIAHKELENAIEKLYIKEKKACIAKLKDYYMSVNKKHYGVPLPPHLLKELLWATRACEDRDSLIGILTTPDMFTYFIANDYEAYVFDHLQWLGMDQFSLINLYHQTFRRYMVSDYCEQLDEDFLAHPDVAPKLLKNLTNFHYFLKFAQYLQAQKLNLEYMDRILDMNTQMDPDLRLQTRIDVKVKQGQVCLENRENEDCVKHLQKAVELITERYPSTSKMSTKVVEDLGTAYHTMGVAKRFMGELEEAEELIKKSIDTHKGNKMERSEEHIRQSKKALAEIMFDRRMFRESADVFEALVKEEEEASAGLLDKQVAYTLTSLSICYRRLELWDKAEAALKKAMDIKTTMLGDKHRDIAIAYVNIANLMKDRGNLEEMVANLDKALEIHKFLGDVPLESNNALICIDNKIMALIFRQRWEDANDIYWQNFDAMKTHFDFALSFNHENIFRYCLRQQKLDDAAKILRLLVESKHVQPDHFIFLNELHIKGQLTDPEPLPTHLDLSSAMNKYPGNEQLLLARAEFEWIPQKDAAIIITELETFLKHLPEDSDRTRPVCLVAEKCSMAEWLEGDITILKHFSDKYPNEDSYVRNLSVSYYKNGELDKSAEYFRKSIALKPEIAVLQDKLVMVLLVSRRLDEAEEELHVLQDRFGTQPEIAELVGKYRAHLEELRSQKED